MTQFGWVRHQLCNGYDYNLLLALYTVPTLSSHYGKPQNQILPLTTPADTPCSGNEGQQCFVVVPLGGKALTI